MADVNPFPSFLGSFGSSLLTSELNMFNQKRLNQQQQAYYRENAQQQYKFGQQAQKNAAVNSVAGMKAAGINPLTAGGSFSPAQSGSAPLGTSSVPQADSPFPQMIEAINAKTQLANAETNRINAETQQSAVESQNELRGVQKETADVDLARKQAEDDTMDKFLRNSFAAWQKSQNPIIKAAGDSVAAELAANDGQFNKGSLQGFANLRDFLVDAEKTLEKIETAKLGAEVANLQRTTAGIKASIAAMPAAKIAEIRQNIAESLTKMAVNNQSVEKMSSEIGKILIEAQVISNSDWMTLQQNGNAAGSILRLILGKDLPSAIGNLKGFKISTEKTVNPQPVNPQPVKSARFDKFPKQAKHKTFK